jgi:hypothetical protein
MTGLLSPLAFLRHSILILAAFAYMLLGLVFFATWIGVVFLLTALAFCAVGLEWK